MTDAADLADDVWRQLPDDAQVRLLRAVLQSHIRRPWSGRLPELLCGAAAVLALWLAPITRSVPALVVLVLAGGAHLATRRNPVLHGGSCIRPIGHATFHGTPEEIVASFTAVPHRQHRDMWVPRYDLPAVAAVLRATMLELDPDTLPAALCTCAEARAYGVDAIIEQACGAGTFDMAKVLAAQSANRSLTLSNLQRTLLQVQHRA